MNVDQYLQRLAGLDRPMSPTVTPQQADPWNNQTPPNSLPYMDRFAGGRMRSTYTPYNGDPLTYGYGGQHRYFTPDTTNWTGTNTSTATTTATNTTDPTYGGGGTDQGSGGDDRSSGRDNAKDPSRADFMRDLGELGKMASPIGGAINNALGDPLGVNGNYGGGLRSGGVAQDLAAFSGDPTASVTPGGGLNTGGMADDMAAFGGNDPTGGSPASGGNADAWGGSGEKMAKGGIVEGDRKRGVDDVTIRADGGEGVIKSVIVKDLGEDFIKRLNAGKYDRRLLMRAVHA